MMRGVRFSEMDRKITIQEEVEISEDNQYNEKQLRWQNISPNPEIWCSVKEYQGNEAYQADRLTSIGVTVFTIRYRPDLTRKMRAIYGAAIYNIVSITEPIGFRRQLMEIRAELSTDDAKE